MSAIDTATKGRAAAHAGCWFRGGPVDAWLLVATATQTLVVGSALLAAHHLRGISAVPAAGIVAVGLWWNANTIAHIHIHQPVFRHRPMNQALSVWLSVLLGFPQVLWRHRHMWHHAGEPAKWPPLRWEPQGVLELVVLVLALTTLASLSLWTLLLVWLPGYGLGMALCWLQAHYEHHLGGTSLAAGVSHYGRYYNFLWLNDGYHVEHHLFPSHHWTRLPELTDGRESRSIWPPVLRWVEQMPPGGAWTARVLIWLERIVLCCRPLQHWMIRRHRDAFIRVLKTLPRLPRHVLVIGGGLFPRTVAVLSDLLPEAELVVIERNEEHIRLAQKWLTRHVPEARVRLECTHFDPATAYSRSTDLVVLPLGFFGDRAEILQRARTPVLEHAWLWEVKGANSAVVAWVLCKRVNLLLPAT